MTTPAAGPALSLRGAAMSFGERVLWSGVDLELQPGEFLAVLGTNGAGKSTLLKAVLGQQPLSSGQLLTGGRPPGRGSAAVGYVPQQKSMDAATPLRARDLVGLGIDGHRWGPRRRSAAERRRIAEALEAVGATEYADAPLGLLTRRLAACLLMTDFPNPVFSARRASLLAHVPARAVVTAGESSFSTEMGKAITAAAPGTPGGSPEREFAARWALGDDFAAAFDEELLRYYRAVSDRLATQQGYDDFVRLAESRRDRVRAMPIFESPLLFAQTDVPRRARAMRADATVLEV